MVQASLKKKEIISVHVSHLKSNISSQKSTGKKAKRWKSGAGSFSTGAETWNVMETEGFAPGLRTWICFIQQSKPRLYTNGDRMCLPRYVVCLGSTVHRFKHVVRAPPAQRYNCHRCSQLQPMIYYLAVFCPTWVHITAHNVALLQRALLCF